MVCVFLFSAQPVALLTQPVALLAQPVALLAQLVALLATKPKRLVCQTKGFSESPLIPYPSSEG